MKKFLFAALAVMAVAFMSCEPKPTVCPDCGKEPCVCEICDVCGENPCVCDTTTTPEKPEIPVVEATEGTVTVVWNAVGFVPCIENQLVFAGSYNGYNTNPDEMVKFQAIEGYEGWWKAVITPADPAAEPALEGKPCALYMDGTFPSSWDHQWLNVEAGACEILDGEAELQVEYEVESKLIVAKNSSVVYVRSYGFKTDPCLEPETYTVSLTASAPALPDSVIVYAVGAFNSWTTDATPMTLANGVWTATIENVVMGAEYKYVANASWDNEELLEAAEGAVCAEGLSGNRKINDVEVVDAIGNFKDITIMKCDPKDITVKAQVPAAWTDTITAWVWATGEEGAEVVPTKDGDWYVYTLNCNELNIIFKNGHGWNGDKNQTEDLKGIRESVCYQLAQEGDAKATATAVDCPAAE